MLLFAENRELRIVIGDNGRQQAGREQEAFRPRIATSGMGQSHHFDREPATSGLPRSTDIVRRARLVRLVPILLARKRLERGLPWRAA